MYSSSWVNYDPKPIMYIIYGQRTKNEERRTKNEELRTKNDERRAKSEERRTKNEERRAKSEERRAIFILVKEVPCETLKCPPWLFASQPHEQKVPLAKSVQE